MADFSMTIDFFVVSYDWPGAPHATKNCSNLLPVPVHRKQIPYELVSSPTSRIRRICLLMRETFLGSLNCRLLFRSLSTPKDAQLRNFRGIFRGLGRTDGRGVD